MDIFRYICGIFTLQGQRRNINNLSGRYFKVPLGDQDRKLGSSQSVQSCVETLWSWSQGKSTKLKFGVPMVWREPANHLDNCYFKFFDVPGFNLRKRNNTYSTISLQGFCQTTSCTLWGNTCALIYWIARDWSLSPQFTCFYRWRWWDRSFWAICHGADCGRLSLFI